MRITAQLIEAATGHHVWVDRFDRELDNVFAVQDELTQRIAANLEPAIGKAELARSKTKPPDNLDAWDYYLRGRSSESSEQSQADRSKPHLQPKHVWAIPIRLQLDRRIRDLALGGRSSEMEVSS